MPFFNSKKAKAVDLIAQVKINLEDYELIGEELSDSGKKIKILFNPLSAPLFNLFTDSTLLIFEDDSMNLFFRSDINNTDYDELKSFVNSLVDFYGHDSTYSGKVTDEEIDNIVINNFWSGRSWHSESPAVSVDGIDEEFFRLSIRGYKISN